MNLRVYVLHGFVCFKTLKRLFSNFFGHETKRRKKTLWHSCGTEDLLIWLSLKHWIRSNICSVGRIIWPRHLIDALEFCMFFQAQDIIDGRIVFDCGRTHSRHFSAMADRCNIGTFHWQRGNLSFYLSEGLLINLKYRLVDWLTALSIYHSITFLWIPPLVFDRQSCLVNPWLISQTQIRMKTWHSPLSWSFLWAGTTPGWQVVARLRVSRGFARTFLSWSDCLTRLWLHLTKLPPTCGKLIQQWLAAYSSSMGSQKKPPTSRRRSPKLWGTF